MNDYEAHLSSYDHSHKQRLRDMKAMVRDPNASSRARKAEAKADGIVSIKMDSVGGNGAAPAAAGGFKKGGFKKSGFKSAFGQPGGDAPTKETGSNVNSPAISATPGNPSLSKSALVESDTEDEGYEVYDPRYPTD